MERGIAMAARPPALRGTSVTDAGGGRHGASGGGAAGSRPAEAQTHGRLNGGAPCGGRMMGRERKIKKSNLGPAKHVHSGRERRVNIYYMPKIPLQLAAQVGEGIRSCEIIGAVSRQHPCILIGCQ